MVLDLQTKLLPRIHEFKRINTTNNSINRHMENSHENGLLKLMNKNFCELSLVRKES